MYRVYIRTIMYVYAMCVNLLSVWLMLQEFDEARDADDAVYDLNGKELLGDRYRIFLSPF